MGLSEGSDETVSTCHCCGKLEDRLSKCRSEACHLVLVVCAACEDDSDPRCCLSCKNADLLVEGAELKKRPKIICACEQDREAKLWGGKAQVKLSQGRKKPNTMGHIGHTETNIKIKVFD